MAGKELSDGRMMENLAIDRKNIYLKWFLIATRVAFGIILIAASIDKVIHPLQFAQAVENYQVIGERLSRWIAIWLPYLEFITGVLLIAGVWLDAAVIANFVMMFIFFAAVTQAYLRGLDISCGCFSAEGGSELNFTKLLYNLFLLGGSFILLLSINKSRVIKGGP